MNFKLHVNQTRRATYERKQIMARSTLTWPSFELDRCFVKKTRADCSTNDQVKGISQGKIPALVFGSPNLPHAELRLHHVGEVKECVCKRLDEFGGFIKHRMVCFATCNAGD